MLGEKPDFHGQPKACPGCRGVCSDEAWHRPSLKWEALDDRASGEDFDVLHPHKLGEELVQITGAHGAPAFFVQAVGVEHEPAARGGAEVVEGAFEEVVAVLRSKAPAADTDGLSHGGDGVDGSVALRAYDQEL